jgi:L-cystine uptake protein TcyP (sodium:dicarboxylate symporter family)
MVFSFLNSISIILLSITVIVSGIGGFKISKELNLTNRRLNELENEVATWKKAHSKCTGSCCVEKVLDNIIKDME